MCVCVCVCVRCGSAILLCGLTTALAVPEEWNVIIPIVCCTRTHNLAQSPVLALQISTCRYSLWRKPPVLTSADMYMYM